VAYLIIQGTQPGSPQHSGGPVEFLFKPYLQQFESLSIQRTVQGRIEDLVGESFFALACTTQ